MHSIGFAVIDRDPVSVELCGGVRRARIKWRRLVLRSRLRLPIQLRCRRLIETGFLTKAQDADRFEIINFLRLNLLNDANEVRRIGEVALMQKKANAGLMQVMI